MNKKNKLNNMTLRRLRRYTAFIFTCCLMLGLSLTAFASGDPIGVVNNLTLAGGIVITFAKEILDLIVG